MLSTATPVLPVRWDFSRKRTIKHYATHAARLMMRTKMKWAPPAARLARTDGLVEPLNKVRPQAASNAQLAPSWWPWPTPSVTAKHVQLASLTSSQVALVSKIVKRAARGNLFQQQTACRHLMTTSWIAKIVRQGCTIHTRAKISATFVKSRHPQVLHRVQGYVQWVHTVLSLWVVHTTVSSVRMATTVIARTYPNANLA